jgi:two-component sensor histidine kinase
LSEEVSAVRNRRTSGANAAIALLIIFFGMFLGLLAITAVNAYRHAEQRAYARAGTAAQVTATNARWIVELARQALRRMDEALGADLGNETGRVVRDIDQAVDNLPGTVKAYIVNTEGYAIYSTDPQLRPISIADREYFSTLAAGDPWHISSLLISRLNGEQIFVISRRLERNGQFVGAAILSFDALILRDIWRSLSYDEISTISLVRSDGKLVARYPLPGGPLDLGGRELITEHLATGDSGTYLAVSPEDGVKRYVGFARVPESNLVAVGAVSADSAMSSFRRSMGIMLLIALPATAGLGAATLWIVSLLRREEQRKRELAETLELNRLLFRDTHHRVKNNLQAVQSLVSMQKMPQEAKSALQSRIAAMAAVHEHIYRLDQYVEVDAAEFIPAIVKPLLASFNPHVSVEFDLESLQVDRNYTTPLALLVNEVVTNALKYAYPGEGGGSILVSLKKIGPGRARLEIHDDGVGFDPQANVEGMGSRLIRAMVRQMHGTYAYRHEQGTTFSCEINVEPPGQADMSGDNDTAQPDLAAAQ